VLEKKNGNTSSVARDAPVGAACPGRVVDQRLHLDDAGRGVDLAEPHVAFAPLAVAPGRPVEPAAVAAQCDPATEADVVVHPHPRTGDEAAVLRDRRIAPRRIGRGVVARRIGGRRRRGVDRCERIDRGVDRVDLGVDRRHRRIDADRSRIERPRVARSCPLAVAGDRQRRDGPKAERERCCCS
jgi:hypothetical protein